MRSGSKVRPANGPGNLPSINEANQVSFKTPDNYPMLVDDADFRLVSSRLSENSPQGFQDHGPMWQPIKGPIERQMWVALIFFVLVVATAQISDWLEHVRAYNLIAYFVVCLCIMEGNRYLYLVDQYSAKPMYTNIVPFMLLLVASREAHNIICLMFYAGVMIIHLQSGAPHLRRHILAYTSCFLVAYSVTVAGMAYFYIDKTGTDEFFGRQLSPPITVGQEITIAISIILICLGILMLEDFVQTYK
eukprot:TRINITY_DN11_c1_g2_i8.p1 TRINITY_DN11_c1_g2~~TRINITY_DN11_c1_g2_i8.p1  ORF type:complete len:247 (-),score=45.47 TRINITY_DN11_c1_g2_i8:558-1298(-)